MTASQVTALPAQSSLCGQTGTGSSKPSLPETVCLGARSCLSPLQLLHWMFQGKIFHQQDCVLCIIFMENIQFQPWRHEAFVMRPWCCLGLTWVNVGHSSQTPEVTLAGVSSLSPRSELENILMSRKCTGATDHTPTWAETELWWSRTGKVSLLQVSHTRSQVVNHNDLSQR